MVFLRMFCYMIVFLLGAYSILRYFHLFQRNRIPNAFYFIINLFLLVNLFVCYRKVTWIDNEVLRNVLQGLGAIYLSVLLYTPIFCFFRGAFRLVGKRKNKPGKIYKFFNHPAKTIYIILILTTFIGILSMLNMRTIREISYKVDVSKESQRESLSLVFVADTHIGSGMTRNGVEKLVQKVNEQKPEIIVLGGDIFDENTTQSLKDYTSEEFKKLNASEGVYYIEGNHEPRLKEDYTEYFTKAGITVLQDQIAFLPDGLQIVGLRDSVDSKKISVKKIMDSVDREKPVLVLTHRPKQLEELRRAGADVVLCGHTHGGQYPLGFLAILAANDMNYGLKKFDTMSAITTSGAGGYGIPSKLTVPSEIVKINIRFNQ